MTKLIKEHPISTILVSLYVFTLLAFGLYALTCATEWCRLVLVIPLTPWPQLDGALPIDIPQYFLPVGAVINGFVLWLIGRGLEKLFIR